MMTGTTLELAELSIQKSSTKRSSKRFMPGQTVGTVADIKAVIYKVWREELIDHGMYPLQSSVDVSARSLVHYTTTSAKVAALYYRRMCN